MLKPSGNTTAGNPVSVTHPVTVDLTAVAVSINAITADDVINAAEKGAALTLSGSTSGVEAGQTVTVTFGGKTYTASVAANGSWSTTVPATDMAALRDGDASAQANVSNVNGNSATTTHAYSVDATAPTVTINTIAGDDILQISLDGGVTWTTLTVIGTSWSYADGRTLTDGTWNYTVRVVDLAGNVGQTATQNVVVDTTSPEAAKSITITGISDDTGASSSDFITSDTSLTVRGVLGAALGANEFAQISTDNGATWVNVTVAADGLNWSYVDGRTLTNGTAVAEGGCAQRICR
nr:Ig-like domain-containing protein [Escherichia coli]